ncbi:MAG: ATP-dependent helicase HrpB [Gemmatimonadaceae bacterium]|nr:ATP-dependent helicase HrpB [Gemmatimonadaceae bacterium]
MSLPIEAIIPALLETLEQHRRVVLEAPPGAGKTTRVPLALQNASWLQHQKVIMLEPRRLATRAAAHYMARQLGESVGETVGYRIRGESRISARTKIEVVTEGVLTRLLADDAALEAYGAVVFDEFHERSLHADLGLALALETQEHLRPELRILIMSATLDGDQVARVLREPSGDVPVVRSDGRMYPVVTHHRAPRADERIEASVARTVREALANETGDVLVFLPGMQEQRRVAERLVNDPASLMARATVHVLHGSLPIAAQDAAIAAAPIGERKVVLATSIAETSLTIEGVRVVVDSGWSRVPRYDARAGFTRLETVRVSRASADQRRGRAGRVAPGVCYRVWDAAADHMLAPRTRPEVLDADLSSLALELADVGVHDVESLRWMDVPPAGAFAQARELLTQLGALDARGRISAHGRAMARLPLAPRFAHLLLTASARGLGDVAADVVALLEERDILRGDQGPPPVDLRLRLEVLRRTAGAGETSLHGAVIDHDTLRRVRELSQQLRRYVGAPTSRTVRSEVDLLASVGLLVALGFPDRVAQHRSGAAPRFLLRAGMGAALSRAESLAGESWLAIADLDGAPPEYRIARAAPLSRDDVDELFADQILRRDVVEWDDTTDGVRARRQTTLGAIVLAEHPLANIDPAVVQSQLIETIMRRGVDALPWSDSGRATRARLACVHQYFGAPWPSMDAAVLGASLHEWLAPDLDGIRTWSALAALDWSGILLSSMTWEQRQALDRLVPTHIEVPSGSRITVHYDEPAVPMMSVKLQEVFGWTHTPTVCDGRVPVTLHLLSPAQRPVQVTRDLAGFWRTSYFEVRKELRGRYPRHPWPDDPLTAPATRRAKPRGT